MNIDVVLVNAFTSDGKGGNPAGVVLNADQLSDAQKLQVAQTVGYSETAFVCHDYDADFEVSFFTTTGEVDFCGHATLATFSTLFQHGLLAHGSYTQRTKVGVLAITIEPSGKVVMEQQLPQKLNSFSYQTIADIIGIESDIIASTQLPIETISTGLPDVLIPVPNGILDTIEPDNELIASFCKKHNVIGFHIFELCNPNSSLTASCRNFAPLFGITEESATGSSSGALACYLTEHLDINKDFVFEQGRAMNCTSQITASIKSDNDEITDVKVGGFATEIDTIVVSIYTQAT